MAQMPEETEMNIKVNAAFILAKPGDTLILAVPGSSRLSQQETYDREQVVRQRCPQLADVLIVDAVQVAAVEPQDAQP